MRSHTDLPPIERILARLQSEASGYERSLGGIAERLTWLAKDDPHRDSVYAIRRAVVRDLAQVNEEINALTAVIELAST